MVNYQNGKIYKIVNDTISMIYYGSTAEKNLSNRMAKHRDACKKKLTITYEKWGDIKDCKIFLVESFPCETKYELHARERFYIENNECCNHVIPTRNHNEYRRDNIEKEKMWAKKSYDKNKESLLKQKAEYYQLKKEEIKKKNKERYYKNQEKILEQKKEKYQQNKNLTK